MYTSLGDGWCLVHHVEELRSKLSLGPAKRSMNVAPIHLVVSAGDLRKQNRSQGHAIEGCSPLWRPASLRCNSHIPLSLLSCFTRSVAPIDFPPACPHPYSLAMQYGVAVIGNPLRLPPHYAEFIKGWDLDFASTFPIAVFVTHPYSSCSFLILNKSCLLFVYQYYKMSFWF